LDEPFSGLDPIGRKDIRDTLLEQRAAGKTLLMTSHVLRHVEMLCDQIAIVQRGKLVASGKLNDLLKPRCAGRARAGERVASARGDAEGAGRVAARAARAHASWWSKVMQTCRRC